MNKSSNYPGKGGDLYTFVLKERKIDLSEAKQSSFLDACTSIVNEYPDSKIEDLLELAKDRLGEILTTPVTSSEGTVTLAADGENQYKKSKPTP